MDPVEAQSVITMLAGLSPLLLVMYVMQAVFDTLARYVIRKCADLLSRLKRRKS